MTQVFVVFVLSTYLLPCVLIFHYEGYITPPVILGFQSEVMTPPQSLNLSDSVTIDMADTSSPAVNEKTIIDEIKESTPQCWRHLYHLLDLYATMPEPKTVMRKSTLRKQLPVIEEEDDKESMIRTELERRAMTPEVDIKASAGRVDLAAAEESRLGDQPSLARTSFIRTRFKQSKSGMKKE